MSSANFTNRGSDGARFPFQIWVPRASRNAARISSNRFRSVPAGMKHASFQRCFADFTKSLTMAAGRPSCSYFCHAATTSFLQPRRNLASDLAVAGMRSANSGPGHIALAWLRDDSLRKQRGEQSSVKTFAHHPTTMDDGLAISRCCCAKTHCLRGITPSQIF